MRLLSCLVLLTIVSTVPADPPDLSASVALARSRAAAEAFRPRATDPLAQPAAAKPTRGHCGCLLGADCSCGPFCLCSELAKKSPADTAFDLVRARAVREGLAVLICVGCHEGGECCPDVPGCLRYSRDTFRSLGISQGIAVTVPGDGSAAMPERGELYVVADLPLGASREMVLRALRREPVAAPVRTQTYYAPQYFAAPPMMFSSGACRGGG